MAKVDIFSGFLGAGKTTLIKKLIKEAYQGEEVVLIENEFGEIGVDGGFLKDSGVIINEMNAGCICCSLVGDFSDALKQVVEQFHPDRILIEPSGVGKLSDIVDAVEGLDIPELVLNTFTTVVDAKKAKVYMKNFGEFYNNQVEHASAIILSHTQGMSEEKLKAVVELLRSHNDHAVIVTTDWDMLDGARMLEAMENKDTLKKAVELLAAEERDHHDHHHHDDDDDDHECCHHDHDHEHGHHHHHADEIFESWGIETARRFSEDELRGILNALSDEARYGTILRAKGIVAGAEGDWIYFDYVPGEIDIRRGSPAVTGRLCVIGAHIKENALKELFDLG